MSKRPLASPVLVAAACLSMTGGAPAAPRDELLRLVPDDAGLCFVVRDLRGHLERLRNAPFTTQLAASRVGQALARSPELPKLTGFDALLTASLGLTAEQLRDDIFGDAVVLAYTPGPPDKPEQERGLLLVHVRRPDLLATLLARVNDLQTKTGEVTAIEPRTHLGQTYFCRKKAKDGDEFYTVRGSLLAVVDKEVSLRQLIERDQKAPPVAAALPPLARKLDGLGVGQSLAVCWVNPPAFAPALRHKAKAAAGADAIFLGAFIRHWDALEGAALFVAVDREVSVGVATRVRPESLPEPARRLLVGTAPASPLWASFPEHALFAAAGRVPLVPLVETGAEFLTPEVRQEVRDSLAKSVGALLGRDLLPVLLERLGPDWGVFVTPPEPGGKTWLPSLTAVLRLRTGDGPPAEQRVLEGLDFVARLAMVAYNSRHPDQIRLQTVKQDGVEVRYLEQGQSFPPGLRPAFAWKGDYLVFATSPEAVGRFTPPRGDPPASAAETPLVRIALQGWAGYLRAYRDPLASFLADAHTMPAEDVRRQLDGLLAGLEPFEMLELTQRTGPGQSVLTLRLRTLARLQPGE